MYHLTDEDKAKVLQGWEEHKAMCGCNAGHGVACAAAKVFHHGGSNKRLLEKSYEVCAATALFLIMEKCLVPDAGIREGDRVCAKVPNNDTNEGLIHGVILEVVRNFWSPGHPQGGALVRWLHSGEESYWPIDQLVRA